MAAEHLMVGTVLFANEESICPSGRTKGTYPMARTRFLRLLFSLVVLSVLVLGIRPTSSQGLDPQSLVGEWTGKWVRVGTTSSKREFSNFYNLTIERVVGKRVYGSCESAGKSVESFKFEGVLDGNHLRFGRNVVTDLEIANDQMEGSTTNGTKISLRKKK